MRGLAIAYEVVDVTAIPQSGRQFDLILDSYCINHIVFSRERRSVFESVKAMLKPKGYYLVSSSVYESGRHSREERVVDRSTGQTYDTYDGDCLNGKTYIPKRCYRDRKRLVAEVESCGFECVLQHGEHGENSIYVHRGSGMSLVPPSCA